MNFAGEYPSFLSRTIETPKAPVKKIRFAPGKGNTKIFVLYSSRFDIREIGGDEGMIAQLKWGGREAGSHLMVEDADWATSDKPVLLTGDGCVRVFDIKLQHCQSVVTVTDFAGWLVLVGCVSTDQNIFNDVRHYST
jgi:hypothetical protein